jgi:hypothetical protein
MAKRSILDDAAEQLVGIIPMGQDPRRMKPGPVVRLLNSTPLGTVLSDRVLRRHREQGGLRIGDDKTVDLLKYAAWLCHSELATAAANSPPAVAAKAVKTEEDKAADYLKKKIAEAARNRSIRRAGRDIGELPPVKDPARRAAGLASYQYFCKAYFPHQFDLEPSEDHNRADLKCERAVRMGGLFSLAMPRGSGKTTRLEKLCIWAPLEAKRNFLLLLGVSQEAAEEILANIKTDIVHNDLLAEDFPEIVYPFRALEDNPQNCRGQLYLGNPTYIGWGQNEIIFPYIPVAATSGIVIRAAGLTGRLRGMKWTRPHDGLTVRPDFILPDDPQTDETAANPLQSRRRERLLCGAILGLAGPGKKMAGFMPLTVIERGDMADNTLDPIKHPEWQGERCKLLYIFPDRMDLWDQYSQLRGDSLRQHGDIRLATAFYEKNREAMDAGAKVAWPARFEPDEVSALQYAMNLFYNDRAVFYAEYQNDPEGGLSDDIKLTDPEIIAARLNLLDRYTVPLWGTKLTAMIDVQHSLLYWAVVAWSEQFGGSVIDYGAWPEQKRKYFTLKQADPVFDNRYPGRSVKGQVFAALTNCTDWLLDREFMREDNTPMKIDRCLADGKDQEVAEEIYTVCRTSKFGAILNPSGGKGIGPGDLPMMEYNIKQGEKLGQNWLMKRSAKHAMNHFIVDTNFWKSFVHDRIETPIGEMGALTFYGKPGADHRMVADHLVAETRDRQFSERTQRKVTIWRAKPGRPDNHFFDCIVGAAVAASIEGITLPGLAPLTKQKRERVSFAEMQRRRRGA